MFTLAFRPAGRIFKMFDHYKPQIEFSHTEENRLPSYLASYLKAAEVINLDRQQTLDFLGQGKRETNPILGATPPRNKVNATVGLLSLLPLLMKPLPDWAKSSIAESIAMTEEMVTDRNARLDRGEKVPPSVWPHGLAAKFTYHGDWDRPIEKHIGLLSSWLNRR